MHGPRGPGGPPRVLVVINRFTEVGGAEGSTALIVDGLQGESMRFGVVTLHGLELRARADFEARGVRFWESGRGLASQVTTVVNAINAFRPDVVHAILFDAELAACIAGKWCDVPVIRSIVNTPYDGPARASAQSPRRLAVVRHVDRTLARFATYRFHAISETTAASAEKWLGVEPDRIDVVARGRDARVLGRCGPERRATARSGLGVRDTSLVLLNAARQDPQKGQLLLLDAFSVVHESIPDSVLVIAGREGPESPAIQARVDALGLWDAVRVLGVRDDVADLLCAADVFVFPSLWEGLGGALLEAMALGVPVVAFDVPAVVETLDGTGVTVPLGDVGAYARAIVELARSPERRVELSEQARARFEARYTTGTMLEGMGNLYARVAWETRDAPGRTRGARSKDLA